MDRTEFLRRAGAGAAGLALATSAPRRRSARAQASKPNILLIMTDDQPYHTVGIMESLKNRVVEAGMRFDNGYVATPVCGPARGSVLTGKWSHNTGLESTSGAWRDLVDSGELARNVARRLKAVGYTCHLSGKFTNDLNNGEWCGPASTTGGRNWRTSTTRTASILAREAPAASRYPETAPRRATRPW